MKRHPLSIAFDTFRERWWEMFEGASSGQYLENRLRTAFDEGWRSAERQMDAALNHHRDVPEPATHVPAVAPISNEDVRDAR